MSLTSKGSAWPKFGWGLVAVFGACTQQPSETRPAPSAALPTVPAAPKALASSASNAASAAGPFGCQTLRPQAQWEPEGPETIRLRPPDPAKKSIVLNKTGVLATFSRDEFLIAARCLDLKQAVINLEAETGHTKESPLRDAFGLSYVAAALLDAGRVGVRLRAEAESRQTIVREVWSREGCEGECRGFGRAYRLTEADPFAFFTVSDRVVHRGEPKPK